MDGNGGRQKGGLSDLVVVDLSRSPAASFAGVMMADYNARVIMLEEKEGSPMRTAGPAAWWLVAARNKSSLRIDMAHREAMNVVAALFSSADIVLTDLPPDEFAKAPWSASYAASDPKPGLLHLFPPGADDRGWAWGSCAPLSAAISGLMALTGEPDGPPLQPDAPIAEHVAGILGALRAVAEARSARLAGTAVPDIRVATHEAVMRMIEWQVPVATALGRPELRNANNFPMNAGISNLHRTRDDRYVAISAASQEVALRLLRMIGGEALAADPRYSTLRARAVKENMEEIYRIIDCWIGEREEKAILAAAAEHDVVIGPIYDVRDMLEDPHFRARQDIVEVSGGAAPAPIPMPAVLPPIPGVESRIRRAGPLLGEDTAAILAWLGYSDEEIAMFRDSGLIHPDE
jgi:crotonobetainyl-CoA:carnitine CoA-transferase CaiB-like acyl-CoA transferase